MTKYLFAPLLFLLLLPNLARANFLLIEPAVGYNQGHNDLFAASGIGMDFKLGALLGNSFYLAGDVDYSMLALASVPPASGASENATLMDMGALLGWDMKGFRLWYTYYFSSKLSWTSAGTTSSYSGNAMKFGIGGDLGKNVSLNLEFLVHNFTTQNLAGTTSQTANFMDLGFISISWRL